MSIERSLVLIKPEAVARGLTGAIVSRFEGNDLKLAAIKMLHLDRETASRHYAVHRERPFFPDLVEYITSGPIVAMVLQGEGAIERVRKAMGATDPSKAEVGTIRKDFGLDIQRNAVHGSDSAQTASEEIKLFFAGDEIFG